MKHLSQASRKAVAAIGTQRLCRFFRVDTRTFNELTLNPDNAVVLNYAILNVRQRERKPPRPKTYLLLDFPPNFVTDFPEIAAHAIHGKRQDLKLFNDYDAVVAHRIGWRVLQQSSDLSWYDHKSGDRVRDTTFRRFEQLGWARISQRKPIRLMLTPLGRQKLEEWDVANGSEPTPKSEPRREDPYSQDQALRACRRGLPFADAAVRFAPVVIERLVAGKRILRDPLSGCYITPPPRKRTPPPPKDPLGVWTRRHLERAQLGTLPIRHWPKLAGKGLLDRTTGKPTPKALALLAVSR